MRIMNKEEQTIKDYSTAYPICGKRNFVIDQSYDEDDEEKRHILDEI